MKIHTKSMEKYTSSFVTGSLALMLVMAPASAFAYLSPEQVFGGQSLTLDRTDATTYQAPPQQREGDAVIQSQQQNSSNLRSAAQSSLQPNYAEPVDTYVPPTQSSSLGLFDQNATYEKRMDRIQQDRASGPTIVIGGDGTVIDSNGNVLHSGAPRVTATGPESILTFAAMILAGISTLAYAAIRHRRLQNLQIVTLQLP